MKWEREDGLGAKSKNLRLEVKEGCKKMNIIIIYEICMRAVGPYSFLKNTTVSIILFIDCHYIP